jgi:hypothetical protein
MDAKDIRNLSEAYNSVYQPQYISEEVEIATEYFYEMGLNEYGIDILIEELGEDEFVDWVDEIVEESYLEEASQTRLQKMADNKNKILVGPKGSRPQSTTKAAIKKYGGTVRGGISGGVSGVIRKKAATTAIKSQPTTSSTPTQTRQGIGARIGAAFRQGMERHRQATQTAGRLAGQTSQTVGKAVQTGINALNIASDSRLARQARVATKKGFKRQQNAIDKAAPKVGAALGKAAANVPAIRDTYKAGQRLGRALRGEECDYILSYLLDEGYAETVEAAEIILENMGEEWRYEIIDEAQIMSVSGKGGLKYMINPKIVRAQNAAARERQGRQERENQAKDAANVERSAQARKASIQRLNAKPGADSGDYDSGYHGDDDTSGGKRHYSLSRTDRSARKRRASGR